MFTTRLTFHPPMSEDNAEQRLNMLDIFVTDDVSHAPIPWPENVRQQLNIERIFVTEETSHEPMLGQKLEE